MSVGKGTEAEFRLKALTPIWTGGVDQRSDRFHETGLLGSLRWWFEVLVRGLGGKACDPTSDIRCPDPNVTDPAKPGHHCSVCELFGCTGWARKFRLMVVDNNGKVIQGQIQAWQTFILRFIPLRSIWDEEWCLLDATLRLIADYGAIGGKTVFKPSEEWGVVNLGTDDLDDSSRQVRIQRSRRGLPLQRDDAIEEVEGTPIVSLSDLESRLRGKLHGECLKIKVRRRNGAREEIDAWAGKRHHQDFGLIAIEKRPEGIGCTLQQAKGYVQQECWRKNFNDQDFAWASLQNFWYVKRQYLARQNRDQSSFNRVIGRQENKSQAQQLFQNTDANRWLAGRQQESKKVFSFKKPDDARRTFGFVKPGTVDFDEMKDRLRQVWHGFNPDSEFLTGDHILKQLLP